MRARVDALERALERAKREVKRAEVKDEGDLSGLARAFGDIVSAEEWNKEAGLRVRTKWALKKEMKWALKKEIQWWLDAHISEKKAISALKNARGR